jgi:hypothetical protein
MKNIFLILIALFFYNFSYTQCFDDGHSPFENQGWLSCQQSVNPIPERGSTHWILYDLGYNYTIDETYIWNHNVWGETGMGVKQILIDYSADKQNWKTIGPFTIEKAPGSWKYQGSEGPSLGNVTGRYFLITVLSTHDPDVTCAGICELKFSIGESVATEDILEDKAFLLFPNPASSMIRIKTNYSENIQRIFVYNAVGQLQEEINIPAKDQFILPIENYKPGLYHVSVWTKHGIRTESFMKVE